MLRLDAGNRFVHAAVRAVAVGQTPPPLPDDPGWLQRAGQHGVLSTLAAHVNHDDTNLRSIRRARAAHHLRTMADVRVLEQTFASAGVEWLVFKGPVLSEVVYQRRGARSYGDLDILVRPGDVAVAAQRLLHEGAVTIDGGWRAMQERGDGESAYQLPHGTVVDLHWDVINDCRIRPAFNIGPDGLFHRARSVHIDGVELRTFDPIDTVLHVALHACHSGGDRLRWLLDLQQSLVRSENRLPELFGRAMAMRLDLVLRCMLNRLTMFVDGRAWAQNLPAPSMPQRSWLSADRTVMDWFPPGSRYEGRFSGSIVSDSTRDDPLHSWQTMLRAAPRILWIGCRRRAAVGSIFRTGERAVVPP